MRDRDHSRSDAPGPKPRSPLARTGSAGKAGREAGPGPTSAPLVTQAQLRKGEQFSSGTATLDRERLAFRGYFQYQLALAEIRSIQLLRDILKLETSDGYVTLKLGKQASAWAAFIRAHR